ncbi:MAG: ATP phosphoribosyltransferase [Muribaculaceae bacterium]|nr:ATP phosphoribosyltransferase [Muribaculaceae bacterium]
MIKIAIQSKGRLNDKSMELLSAAGISVSGASRSLTAMANGFPLEVLYLRDDDIPQAVAMGVAHLGIVGQNEVAESAQDVREVMPLGFGGCHISLAVPKNTGYYGLQWFNGKRVATSYPGILTKFFTANGIKARIQKIAGSVEVAPAVGMADAIFDIVSTGGTLVQNGLVEVEKVFKSEAVLISTKVLSEENEELLKKLLLRFRSIKESRGFKYVLMNIPSVALEAAVSLMPGMKGPTLIPLAREGWHALQVVIHENELWDKIEKMKEIGAEDILVLDLENIIR